MATDPARPSPARRSPGPKIVRLSPRPAPGTVQLVSDRQLSLSLGDPGNRADKLLATYRLSVDVYRGVRKLTTDISGLGYKLRRGGPDGKEITGRSPLREILDRPNQMWSFGQLMEATALYLLTTGRAHIFLDGSKFPDPPRLASPPRRLWILKTNQVTPRAAPPAGIAFFEWKDGETAVEIPPEFVATVSFIDPEAPYTGGLSPLRPALSSIEQAVNLSRYNASFLRRGATPSAVVTTEGDLNEEERRELEREIRSNWIGADNAGGVFILHGMTIAPFQVSHRDMHYPELHRDTARDIYGAIGVKPAMAGDFGESGGLGAGAQVDMQERSHWKNTIQPLGRLIEYAVNNQIAPLVEPGAHFSFAWEDVSALQESEDAVLDRKIKRLRHGLATPNEILAEEGLTGYEGGDLHFIESSLTPVELASEPPPPPEEPESPTETSPPPAPDEETTPPPPEDDPEAEVEEAGRSLAAIELRRAARWRSVERLRVQAERDLERAWRRELRWLADYIAAKVKVAPPGSVAMGGGERALGDRDLPYDPEFYVPGDEELMERITAGTGPLHEAIVARFGQAALAEIRGGLRFDVNAPGVQELVRRRAAKVGDECARLLRQVKPVLEKGLNEGETVEELVKRIRGTVAGSPLTSSFGGPTVRSLRIARTEAGGAGNAGRIEGFRQAGVASHEWISSRDEFVRDSHAAGAGVDGEIVNVGEPFSNGLLMPGDPEGPPEEIINCRCVTVPVAPEE